MTMQYFRGQVRGLRGPALTSQQATDVAAALAPDRPIIETGGQAFGVPDQEGSYGGGPAMYIKASPQYFRATAMGIAGNLTFTGAATDGRMAGFIKLPVTGSAGVTKRIIADAATSTYLMQDADALITATDYVSIGMFVVGQPGIQGLNGFRWLEPELSHVFPSAPVVVDHGEVLIPRSAIISTATNGFDTIIPEDGSWFFPRDLQADPTVASRYIYDKSLKDVTGGTYDAAVKRVDGVTAPLDDSYKQILLATCSGGFVSSEYFQIVGEQGTPPAEDQNPLGMDADAYPILVNSTITDFTDAAILAMGFTRGAIGPTSGSDRSVYFGLPIKPKFGQHGIVRFVAEVQGTVNSGNYLSVFENPRVFLRLGGSIKSSGTVRMIRRLGDKAAEFIAWVGVATDDAEDVVVGFDKNGADYNVIVSPFSYHFSDAPASWIARPGEGNSDLAHGDQFFATKGRPLVFYPGRATKTRTEMVDFVATIGSGTAGYTRSGKEMIEIEPDRLGSTIDIEIRNPGAPNNRSRKQVDVYLGPASVVPGTVVRPYFEGDSLIGYGMPAAVAQSGQELGYTVETIGTLINEGGGTPTAPLYPGEGHPGKTVAQLVGASPGIDPVADADVDAYLAMSDADKNNRSLLFKVFEPGVDNAAYKFTRSGVDYIYSPARYISVTGQSAPTQVTLSGGRNDAFQDAVNAVANVEFAFDVRYNQWRAAYPTVPIHFVYFGEPVSVENERDWPLEYAIIQAYRKKVAAARLAGDANVYFVSTFAYTTAEMWNDLTVTTTSTESGTQKGALSDTTHMGPISKPQAANCLMDAINATSGATAAKTTDQRVTALDGSVSAVQAQVDGQRLTSGEIALTTAYGEALNGASRIAGPAGGSNWIGFTIPAGASGANSFVNGRMSFSAAQRADLAGKTLRLKALCAVNETFSEFKDLNAVGATVDISGGGSRSNQGETVRNEQIGSYYYREVLYEMVGDEAFAGPVIQVIGSDTEFAHELTLISQSWSIESAEEDKSSTLADAQLADKLDRYYDSKGIEDSISDVAETAADAVAAADAARLTARGEIVGADMLSPGSATNGAVAITDTVGVIGFTLDGVSGAGSFFDRYIEPTEAEKAAWDGRDVRVTTVYTVSDGFQAARLLGPTNRLYINRDGTVTRAEGSVATTQDNATTIRRVMTVAFTDAIDRIGPCTQVTGLNSTGNHSIRLASWAIEPLPLTDKASTSSDEQLSMRLAALTTVASLLAMAVGFVGQSNELGSIKDADEAAHATAFRAATNPAVVMPIGPVNNPVDKGGWWPAVYDIQRARGYDLRFVNAAIGGASFRRDVCGMVHPWTANTGYRQTRSAQAGSEDRGFRGDFVEIGGKIFRCSTGRTAFAFSDGPFTPLGAANNLQDYVSSTGSQATGASIPNVSGITATGQTVTDGTIVWTCVQLDTAGAYGPAGTIFTGALKGAGFDPFGILERAYDEIMRVQGVERRLVYIANGQADATTATQAEYAAALQSIANFWLERRVEVMIGLTCWWPGSTTVAYDRLQAGRADALAALGAGPHAAYVHEGADLYADMGTTGPMASGGAYFQADNVHLNGAGAVGPAIGGVQPASYHVAAKFSALLPDRAS